MRPARERGEIVHRTGLEVHVSQEHDRHGFVDGAVHLVGIDQPEFMAIAEQLRESLRHVEVGREVSALGQNYAAFREGHLWSCRLQVQRGRQCLEEIDRCRVRADDLVRLRADQSRDLGADAARQFGPSRRVPGADQSSAPLALDDLAHAGAGRQRQGPERVAVEIDHALRQAEAAPMRRERIGGVAGQCVIPGHAGNSLSTARTGLASQPAIFRGRAISS